MIITGFEHGIGFIAVRINITKLDGTSSIGSGFLFNALLNDGSGRFITLLVSNKHVFGDPKGTLNILVNKIKDDGEPDFGNIEPFFQVDFSGIFFPHPEGEVDLACVNVSSITHKQIFYRNLDSTFLTPIDEGEIFLGMDVLFVGYPDNRFDQVHNLPIVRKGSIASFPSVDFNGKSELVIDAQVFQGSSGSPVFVQIKGRYRLLGVVSETMIRHSKLQTLPTSHHDMGIQQIIGLGIVIKQSRIIELIDYATQEFLANEHAATNGVAPA